MKPIGIVAPGDARDDVRDVVVGALATEGSVGVVAREDRSAPPPDGVETAVYLGTDGTWTAVGNHRDLDDALEALAPTHDFAVVLGYPGADLPTVVVGGRDHAGRALLEAKTPADVDSGAVRAAVEGVEPHETLASLVAAVKGAPDADRSGAIATFTGRVRERDHSEDTPTTHLEFEKYEGVADERLRALEVELAEREGVQAVRMYHRTGVVESGEDIVFVVVLAGHREEAFRTVSDGIDRLKAEVPIFKKEVTLEEEFWVHERE